MIDAPPLKGSAMRLMLALLGSCFLAPAGIAAPAKVTRTPMLDQPLPTGTALHGVRGQRIEFAPSQPGGRHRHPVPVFGVVTRGRFLFQVEGTPARVLDTGDAFYEPAGAAIAHFDNASASEPAAISVFYLIDDPAAALVEPLPPVKPESPHVP